MLAVLLICTKLIQNRITYASITGNCTVVNVRGALMAAGHYLAAEEIFWLGVMCFLPIVFRIAKFLRDFR